MMEYRAIGPDSRNKYHVAYIIPGSTASKICCECSSYDQAIEAVKVISQEHAKRDMDIHQGMILRGLKIAAIGIH